MAEKKSQTLVRAEPEEIAAWKEAATIRGVSLNQYMTDAANRSLSPLGLDTFATATAKAPALGAAAAVTNSTSAMTTDTVLLAFDVALSQTPTLTGQRKWVDPQALREVLATTLTEPTSD